MPASGRLSSPAKFVRFLCAHFCEYREYQRITDSWEIMILRFKMMFYVINMGVSRMREVWWVGFTTWKTKCLSSSEYDTDVICLEASATQLFSWRRSTETDHNSASTANEKNKIKQLTKHHANHAICTIRKNAKIGVWNFWKVWMAPLETCWSRDGECNECTSRFQCCCFHVTGLETAGGIQVENTFFQSEDEQHKINKKHK